MKRQQFNQPNSKLPQQTKIVRVEDGRKNKILQDQKDALDMELVQTKDALDRTSSRSSELLRSESLLGTLSREQAGELAVLRSVTKQLESEVVELSSLRISLRAEKEARRLAEWRFNNIVASTSNMSQGAITSQGGSKVAMFGPVIPRKHLGGATPNLVRYSVKESN